jgi:hypothetical protein
MGLFAGCSVLSGTTTGSLFVRARNMTPAEQTLSVQLTVAEEETPSIEGSVTLSGATDGTPPWPEHIWQRENVHATESYRVVTVFNDRHYERQDVANCIDEHREGEPAFSAQKHELADISIQSNEVKILTEDCQ